MVVYTEGDEPVYSAVVTKVDPTTGDVTVTGLGRMEEVPHSNPVASGPGGGWSNPPASYSYYTRPYALMRLLLCVIFILSSGLDACANEVENDHYRAPLTVSFEKHSQGSVTIKLLNTDTGPFYYYNSLFSDGDRLPYFLWVRVCENYSEACDNIEWLSPHHRTSAFVKLPIDLTKLNSEEGVSKDIR